MITCINRTDPEACSGPPYAGSTSVFYQKELYLVSMSVAELGRSGTSQDLLEPELTNSLLSKSRQQGLVL